jgi:hypothetical protein
MSRWQQTKKWLRSFPQTLSIAVALIFSCSVVSQASVIRQVSLTEMLQASEFVFEGRVIAVESRFDANQAGIHTRITFEVLDVVKGQHSGRYLELQFLGGTVGDVRLEVSDMHLAELWEKGFYFVESLQRQQVNPIYGWDQGHYLVKVGADNIERVTTRAGQAVVGIERVQDKKSLSLSTGRALGVKIATEPNSEGLTVSEFKQKLQQLVGGVR